MGRRAQKEIVALEDKERESALVWWERWGPRVKNIVRGYRVESSDVEDMVQQLFLEFIQGRYFEIYDPTKGTEITFLRSFIKKRIQQRWSKKQRDPIAKAVPSEVTNAEGETVNVVEELVQDTSAGVDEPRVVDTKQAVEKLAQKLETMGVRSIVMQGKIERSLKSVLELLREGYQQHEIATKLQYSEASVSVLVGKIRTIATEMGLREYSGGKKLQETSV